jgi:hypothetical protein
MTLPAVTHERRARRAVWAVDSNGLFQLGQPQFWLLIGILVGMISLFVLVLFTYLSSF